MYKENFPIRLRKARLDAGYTQPQVSAELKITSGTLSKYENGKLEPDLEKLAMLAEFYAVSIDWLLGIGQKENASPSSDESLRKRQQTALASEIAKKEAFPINILFDIQDQLISKGIIQDNRPPEVLDRYIQSKTTPKEKPPEK